MIGGGAAAAAHRTAICGIGAHPAAAPRITLLPDPLGPLSTVTPLEATSIWSAREVATRGPSPPDHGATSIERSPGEGLRTPLPLGRSIARVSPSPITRSAA